MIITDKIVDTPVESYTISNREVNVKREDLCVEESSFSKIRGLYKHLVSRSENFIGVMDSYHSKAGWGVSYVCSLIGKQAVVFYPEYKYEPGMRESQINSLRLGAEVISIKAGLKGTVQYYKAKKELITALGEDCYMLPNGLKIDETIDETFNQVLTVDDKFFDNTTWVISASSGTITSGVLRALVEVGATVNLIIHLGYDRKEEATLNMIKKHSNVSDFSKINIEIINEKYQYKQGVEFDCPFPCNKYYDLKAWKWLTKNINTIHTEKIMFWNIGA